MGFKLLRNLVENTIFGLKLHKLGENYKIGTNFGENCKIQVNITKCWVENTSLEL